MLTGAADVDALAAHAPTMGSLAAEPVRLDDVEVLQASFELPYSCRGALLPPGLHPTTPPLLTVLAWKVASSPWGPFSMAQARVSCRSGVRPRGLVKGCVVDSRTAAEALSSGWGLPTVTGSVELHRGYDQTELTVERDGRTLAQVMGLNPDPLDVGDVQFTVTTTLAVTPRGLRLVQVEPEYELRRVERLRPRVLQFDGGSWGEALLQPRHPVSGTVSIGDVTIPRIRFLSRPDVLAFEGTERV